jgi:hypothetical protein
MLKETAFSNIQVRSHAKDDMMAKVNWPQLPKGTAIAVVISNTSEN